MSRTPNELLESAASAVVATHSLPSEDGENAVQSLSWALGQELSYEKGLLALTEALLQQSPMPNPSIDTESVIDLLDAKIELLGEYKLDHPQDYEADDLASMQVELQRLVDLRTHLSSPAAG